MSSATATSGVVVVGVDGSPAAGAALRWATQEATIRGLAVTAVMAWDLLDQRHPGGERYFDLDFGEADAAEAIDAAVKSALGSGEAAVARRTVCDLPARGLVAAGIGADLLVVGARGLGGFAGLLLGSVSQHCLHHATCPVAVVRDGAAASFDAKRRVVVGIDGSQESMAAARWALAEARARAAKLVVVHAWQLPPTTVYPYVGDGYDEVLFERAAANVVDETLSAAGRVDADAVELRVVQDGPAGALLDAGRDADVVVVGARGLGAFAGLLLGSVSQHVARHATSPVVVVR